MSDQFYRAFEDRHRGSRDVIKGRLAPYLPFIQPLAEQYPGAPALDLGCGRGEWLEILATTGLSPLGVDQDEDMLDACRVLGLTACQGDAIEYLAALPDNSQAIVSAFHVVEHLSFDDLRKLAAEALRVLKPGGLLIMETPNPENIAVATCNFYLDPTHERPIPPDLLSFVAEYHGFQRVKIVRLQESTELAQCATPALKDVLQGVSPDYAVIAQKEANTDILAATHGVFDQEYGLTLETLSARYDLSTQLKVQHAEARVYQLEAQASQLEGQIHALVNSNSWKLTRPLRWVSEKLRFLVAKV
jgi:O-antigen chain-terminating methyltransferase